MLSYFSRVQFFAILWTVALQAPLSMVFSRQEYWSELPCSSPDPGIEPVSPVTPSLWADSLPLSHQGSTLAYYTSIKFLNSEWVNSRELHSRTPDILSVSMPYKWYSWNCSKLEMTDVWVQASGPSVRSRLRCYTLLAFLFVSEVYTCYLL